MGYETAKNLVVSSQDYHVILGSRDASKGVTAAKELQAANDVKGTVSSTQIDVTDDQSVDAAASRIAAEYGRLDVLVNNAGIVSGQFRNMCCHISHSLLPEYYTNVSIFS